MKSFNSQMTALHYFVYKAIWPLVKETKNCAERQIGMRKVGIYIDCNSKNILYTPNEKKNSRERQN